MLLLSALIFLTLILRQQCIPSRRPVEVPGEYIREVEDFIAGLQEDVPPEKRSREPKTARQPEQRILRPAVFDPNTVTEDELAQMGLRDFVVRNVMKYREAGGRFHTASDLAKIYGLDSAVFSSLEPFVRIPPVRAPDKPVNRNTGRTATDEAFCIEINSAGAEDFIRIRGIGEILAARIIHYRELLGGFASPDQLVEVYGLSDSLVTANAGHFRADTAGLHKLSLNSADFKALLRHPYLDRAMVRSILAFRDFSKEPVRPDDLLKYDVIPDSIFSQIRPYLDK